MKILFTILILLSSFIYPQSSDKEFKTYIKKVDKYYAEFSDHPFNNYVKYTLSKIDGVKIILFNTKGEIVYRENYGVLEPNTYIIKFFNPECPGVYFVSTKIGKQQAFKKSIQITSEVFPIKGIEKLSKNPTSNIEGEWKRSYAEKFIPAIQPQLNGHKIEYHYKYDMTVKFLNDSYKIISEKTDLSNGGKDTTTFDGKFVIKADTLKLYENKKLEKAYHYKIDKDTLSISYFLSDNKGTV